jgi:hypothetical protein
MNVNNEKFGYLRGLAELTEVQYDVIHPNQKNDNDNAATHTHTHTHTPHRHTKTRTHTHTRTD